MNYTFISEAQKEFYESQWTDSFKRTVKEFSEEKVFECFNKIIKQSENPFLTKNSRELSFKTLQKIKMNLGFDYTQTQIKINKKKVKVDSISDYLLLEHFLKEIDLKIPLWPKLKGFYLSINFKVYKQYYTQIKNKFGEETIIFLDNNQENALIFYQYTKKILKTASAKFPNLVRSVTGNNNIECQVFTGERLTELPLGNKYPTYVKNANNMFLIQRKPNLIKIANQLDSAPINKYTLEFADLLEGEIEHIIDSSKIPYYAKKDLSYGAGERFETWPKIGFNLLHVNNKARFEDFVYECYMWNKGSKDMKKKSPQALKTMMLSCWKFCKKNFDVNYFANTGGINDKQQEEVLLSSDKRSYVKYFRNNKLHGHIDPEFLLKLMECLSYIINKENYTKFKKGAVEQNLLSGLVQLYKSVYLKSFYTKARFYTKNKNKPLERGVNVDWREFNTIGRTLGIKNIWKVKKILEEAGLMYAIPNKDGIYFSHNSDFNFCKHWVLVKPDEVLKNYKKQEKLQLLVEFGFDTEDSKFKKAVNFISLNSLINLVYIYLIYLNLLITNYNIIIYLMVKVTPYIIIVYKMIYDFFLALFDMLWFMLNDEGF